MITHALRSLYSLHLTTMCLRYPPTIVACVCIHLACEWSRYKIPESREGKAWFHYIDPSADQALLDRLTQEFLVIFKKCPSRLKKKIMASTEAVSAHAMGSLLQSLNASALCRPSRRRIAGPRATSCPANISQIFPCVLPAAHRPTPLPSRRLALRRTRRFNPPRRQEG